MCTILCLERWKILLRKAECQVLWKENAASLHQKKKKAGIFLQLKVWESVWQPCGALYEFSYLSKLITDFWQFAFVSSKSFFNTPVMWFLHHWLSDTWNRNDTIILNLAGSVWTRDFYNCQDVSIFSLAVHIVSQVPPLLFGSPGEWKDCEDRWHLHS